MTRSVAVYFLFVGCLLAPSGVLAQIQGAGGSSPMPNSGKMVALQGPMDVNEAEVKIMIHSYVKALFDANADGLRGIIGFPHAIGETCLIANNMKDVKLGMTGLERSGEFKLGKIKPLDDRTKLGEKQRSRYTYLASNVPTCSNKRAQALELKAIKMPRRYYLVEVTDSKGELSEVMVRLSYYKKKWHVTGGA